MYEREKRAPTPTHTHIHVHTIHKVKSPKKTRQIIGRTKTKETLSIEIEVKREEKKSDKTNKQAG